MLVIELRLQLFDLLLVQPLDLVDCLLRVIQVLGSELDHLLQFGILLLNLL